MGTGMAANLGPMFGIYMTFFPGIIYALLGSSFHNSVGAFAPSAALVGVAAARTRVIFAGHYLPNQTVEIVGDDLFPEVSREHLEVAVSITLMAGIVQVAVFYPPLYENNGKSYTNGITNQFYKLRYLTIDFVCFALLFREKAIFVH